MLSLFFYHINCWHDYWGKLSAAKIYLFWSRLFPWPGHSQYSCYMHNNSPPLPPHTFWLLLMREKGIMMLYTPILLVLQIWLGFRCCSKIFVDLTSSGLMWNYSYSFSSMSVEPGPLLGNLAVLLGNFKIQTMIQSWKTGKTDMIINLSWYSRFPNCL